MNKSGCVNYNALIGHKNAVLQMHWYTDSSNDSTILSCSADKTLSLWDASQGRRRRRFDGHTGVVNGCNYSRNNTNIFVSGSDDKLVCVWDSRCKTSINTLYHQYQVTSVAISNDGMFVYTGSIDNKIRQFDLRAGFQKEEEVYDEGYELVGHEDTITGLSISQDGNYLLSNRYVYNLYVNIDNEYTNYTIPAYIHVTIRCICQYGCHHT